MNSTRTTAHANARAHQRLGRGLPPETATRLVREIKRAMSRAPGLDRSDLAAEPIGGKQDSGARRWRVFLDGIEWRVVYHVRLRKIVTVLPAYGDENGKWLRSQAGHANP